MSGNQDTYNYDFKCKWDGIYTALCIAIEKAQRHGYNQHTCYDIFAAATKRYEDLGRFSYRDVQYFDDDRLIAIELSKDGVSLQAEPEDGGAETYCIATNNYGDVCPEDLRRRIYAVESKLEFEAEQDKIRRGEMPIEAKDGIVCGAAADLLVNEFCIAHYVGDGCAKLDEAEYLEYGDQFLYPVLIRDKSRAKAASFRGQKRLEELRKLAVTSGTRQLLHIDVFGELWAEPDGTERFVYSEAFRSAGK